MTSVGDKHKDFTNSRANYYGEIASSSLRLQSKESMIYWLSLVGILSLIGTSFCSSESLWILSFGLFFYFN